MSIETTKTFNERSISIVITLYNSSLNICDGPIEDEGVGTVVLNDTNLKYIAFENSILNPIPHGVIEYEDDKTLQSIVRLGSLGASDAMMKIDLNDGTTKETATMFFIITDIKILAVEMDKTLNQIEFEGYNSLYLNKKIPYSTACGIESDYEEVKSPYEIVRSMLVKSGYKERGNATVPYTSVKIPFITGHDTTVMESVKSLLSHGIGINGSNSPVYVVNSLAEGRWQMLTMSDMFSNAHPCDTNISNLFPLSKTELTNTIMDNSGLFDSKMNNIKTFTFDGFGNNANKYKLLNNYQFEEFNHEERSWTSYKMMRSTIKSMMSKNGQSNTTSLFSTSNGDALNETYYSYPMNECTMLYDILVSLECGCSEINIDMNGSFKYDAGQLINISEEGATKTDYQRLYGQWVIVSVKHSFRNQTYTTNMTLCRQNYVGYLDRSSN